MTVTGENVKVGTEPATVTVRGKILNQVTTTTSQTKGIKLL